MPTEVLQGRSPHQVFHKTKPILDHLRTLGCLAYATSLVKDDKFSPRAHACVMMGYSSTQKGYLLYHLNLKKLIVSRKVIFKEHVFPFAQLQDKSMPVFVNDSLKATNYEVCDNDIVVVTPNYVANHDDSAIGDGNNLNGSDAIHIDDVVNGSDTDADDLEAVPAETQEIVEVPEASLYPDTESIVMPITSSRISHPPIWMKKYVTHVIDFDYPHSFANNVSYSKLSFTLSSLSE
ncbi:hypothetical protein KY290_009173 [Solanum tuberosum]|uniref:Retroviral polymerase SH3-like domain-containing protein n=1 Tax=Solanum tuberosum TaxID=4113 RepID=A0ABQ7WAL0_SOLTU|nr:hypothetical protein KY290_009173 [Solanum tuberosum]